MRWTVLPFILCVGLSGCGSRRSPVADVTPADITAIKGSINFLNEKGEWNTDWELTVPPDSFQEVLDLFRAGPVDYSPSKWEVLADLTIQRKTGSPIQIDVYTTSEARCQFKIDGTYYWGRNEQQVTDLLKKFAKPRPPRGP